MLLSNITISNLEKAKYLAKVDSIIYAIIETQIGITFATFMVSWFVKNLSLKHFNIVNQILCYLTGSHENKIIFSEDKDLKWVGYPDSNSAWDHTDQKSIFRFGFVLNRGFISNMAKK